MRNNRGPTIYVVTPPGLPRAMRLADELYELGWNIEIADTPETGAAAGESGNCVIMLTRDGWRAPALVEAIRRRPAVLVPVLAEQMPLPNGPWTTEPIEMRYSLQEVAALVINAIDMPTGRAPVTRQPSRPYPDEMAPERGATRTPSRPRPADDRPLYEERLPSRPRMNDDRPPSRPRETFETFSASRPRGPEDSFSISRPRSMDDSFATSRPRALDDGFGMPRPRDFGDSGRMSSRRSAVVGAQTPPRRGSPLPQILGVFLLLLLVIGGFGGYRYAQSHPGFWQRFGLGGKSTTASTPAYNAAVPGADCDKGGGVWKATTNSNYAFVCQTDSLQMTQKGAFDTFSGVFFAGTNDSIAQNYHVQVKAAIQSTEPTNNVGMIVHVNAGDGANLTSGQVFFVNARGQWEIDRVAATNNAQLALGFLKQGATNYDLSVGVNGAVLTFGINGTTVATVADNTYTTTAYVGLLIGNPGGTQATTVDYSQFVFQPQGAATLAPDLAAATATATANAAITTPYAAAIPGPGCDTGTAQWASPTQLSLDGTVACDGGVLTLTKSVKTGDSTRIGYFGQYGLLPPSYKVEVTINSSKLVDGCAMIGTRFTTKGGYIFAICKDGSWDINLYTAATGAKTKLNGGYVTVATTYNVAVTDNGGTKTFTINGKTATATNATLTDTAYIALGVLTAPNGIESAIFSNFKVTPVQNG